MPPRPGAAAVLLLLLVPLAACGGGGPSATTTPSPSPTRAAAFSEGGRVTLYGADSGDSAGALISGDFNGDGTPDLLLAAAFADGPDNARPDGGEAYVFLGPFTPGAALDAAAAQYNAIIYGAAAGDQLGRAAATGDFNGDGIADIALAAPNGDAEGARVDSGIVYVLFGSRGLGRDSTRIDLAGGGADVTVLGATPADLTGFTLATADLDGDGRTDLLAGAFLSDGPGGARPDGGAVYALYGAHMRRHMDFGAGDQDVTVYGAGAGDRLGEEIAAGDVNGDGRPDLVAVATFAAGPGGGRKAAGEVHVLLSPLGESVDLALDPSFLTVLGTDPGDQLGHSLAVGDTNGDGFADLWMGSVSADGPRNGADLEGEARLVLGADNLPPLIDTLTDGSAALVYGPEAKARLGRSGAGGDVNGDGLADLLVSAPDVQERRGSVYVLPGRRDTARYPQSAAEADYALTGLDPGDILGHESLGMPPLGSADLNGDGSAEILASAPGGDGPQNDRTDAGEAYAVFLEARS
ncbi:MAG: FG-GAP repeat protein [Dehalococcoidia bacterium]|nr:FG-GAP repeat protein [Dehalococcoidia bacterium]